MSNLQQSSIPNNSQSLAFLAAALGAFIVGASICCGAEPAQGATEPTWPPKESLVRPFEQHH
jgi:hypothetical protein